MAKITYVQLKPYQGQEPAEVARQLTKKLRREITTRDVQNAWRSFARNTKRKKQTRKKRR